MIERATLDSAVVQPFTEFGVAFDASADHLDGGTGVHTFDRLDPFSLSIWFRTSNSNTFQILMSKYGTSSPHKGYMFAISSASGLLDFFMTGNSGTADEMRIRLSAGDYRDGKWHNAIAVNTDGTAAGAAIFVDGTEPAVDTVRDTLSVTILSATARFTQGARRETVVFESIIGETTDSAVFSAALTLADAQLIWNDGVPTDIEELALSAQPDSYYRNGNGASDSTTTIFDQIGSADLTATGGVAIVGEAPGQRDITKEYRSSNHDGVNDFIHSGGDATELKFANGVPFSWCWWMKTAATATDSLTVGKHAGGSTKKGWQSRITSAGEVEVLLANTVAGSNYIQVNGTTNVEDGEWHFCCVTVDGTDTAAGVKIYVDNSLESLTTTSDTLSATISDTAFFGIGGQNAGFFYTGNIRHVSVYDAALTAAQEAEIWNEGRPRSDLDDARVTSSTDLVGYFMCGDLEFDTFPTIVDRSVNSNDLTYGNMVSSDIETDVPLEGDW